MFVVENLQTFTYFTLTLNVFKYKNIFSIDTIALWIFTNLFVTNNFSRILTWNHYDMHSDKNKTNKKT